jgi:CHAT domain-containing protein/Tfp pilus assembly protein PilF
MLKTEKLTAELAELRNQGKYKSALAVAQEILDVKKTKLPKNDPDLTESINDLAEIHLDLSEYEKAESLYRSALSIQENALEPNHPNLARTLNGIGLVYHYLSQGTKAIPFFQKAIAIMEKAFGTSHGDISAYLSNLGVTYSSLGEYKKAVTFYERALEIYGEAFSSSHPNIARTLNNLGQAYDVLGRFNDADALYERAFRICEETLGPFHPDMALMLNNQADHNYFTGDYEKALQLYERSLRIWEETLGPSSPNVTYALNGLGLLYRALENHEKAEVVLKRAIGISENSLGLSHPQVALTNNNLALVYLDTGNYDKAKPHFQMALQIWEKTLGPSHDRVGLALNNLAVCYDSAGDPKKAEPLYKRAIDIWQKIFGHSHFYLAYPFNNLGLLYHSLHNFEESGKFLQRAVDIWQEALGNDHPQLTTYLNNLGVCKAATSDIQGAYRIFQRAQSIDDKVIEHVLGFSADGDKTDFVFEINQNLVHFITLVFQSMQGDSDALGIATNLWLKRKGIVLELERRYSESLFYSGDSNANKLLEELGKIRSELTRILFLDVTTEDIQMVQNKIPELENRKSSLESELSRLGKTFLDNSEALRVDFKKLSKALPVGSILIDFAKIELADFTAGSNRDYSETHYFVFLIYPKKEDNIRIIDLGGAEKIDESITLFRKGIDSIRSHEEAKARLKEINELSRTIYDLVLMPLADDLEDCDTIFVSPDGNLNLIPFEVLVDHDGSYLVEKYAFNYLAAGRDIISFTEGKQDSGVFKALLVGDPDFDLTLSKSDEKDEQEIKTDRSSEEKTLFFPRLKGTREEIKSIQKLFLNDECQVYTGSQANEEVLKKGADAQILHLATHGFFLDDIPDCASTSLGRSLMVASRPMGKKIEVKEMPPLLRSGIALAGANIQRGIDDSGQTDGIVTAEEIASLNLNNTEMVVLSACETGLGVIKEGEGVLGLRRAFSMAGAKSLVMSLWKVPDMETSSLMEAFYQNYLFGNLNRCQALREAALKQIRTLENTYGHSNPYYWGGFVFAGTP